MGRSAAAALMVCCVITESEYDLIMGDEGADSTIDQVLQDNDLIQVTNFDGLGPVFVGITYHETTDSNCEEDRSRLSLEQLRSIDIRTGRERAAQVLMEQQDEDDPPEVKAALTNLLLFLQTTETWAIRLIPRYG